MLIKRKFISIVTVFLLLITLFPASGFTMESAQTSAVPFTAPAKKVANSSTSKATKNLKLWYDKPAPNSDAGWLDIHGI